ncbi:hypothetical protein N9Z27_01630 [Alphaproteobacteria bacterium]|nr:hypothetical protein [Alphaproteobacteria bacterium]
MVNTSEGVKEDSRQEPDAKVVGGSSSTVVRLGKSVEIYTDKRLPQYDNGPVKAYQAGTNKSSNANLFALVCERHLVPRHNASEVYAGIMNPSLVSLAASGVVDWPLTKRQHFVLIYKSAPPEPLVKPDVDQALGMRQELAMEVFVKPMIGVLQDFRDKDFVHGSICPSNIYKRGSGAKIESVVLGDCLSAPASYGQSVLYETIPRAMVDPVGRGVGTRVDDIYSFGVSLAVLLRSSDPLQGASDDEIIRQKILQGSYAAVTGKDRFTGSVLELLRGVLHDDPLQRWTIDEILLWTDGARLSPKQSVRHIKAARPLLFSEKKYIRPVFLAMDIDTNPHETQRIVDSGDLEQWIERSLDDQETLERYNVAINSSKEIGTGPGYDDRLVANLSTALDPSAPIRFRGLRLMGDGVGKALCEVVALKQDFRGFVDLFSQNIAMNWVGAQVSSSIDLGSLISKFDQCKKAVKLPKAGYGIERCVYMLSNETPCLSDTFKNHYVLTPDDLVLALEDLCKKGFSPSVFLDRHCVSFLAIRDPKVIENYLYDFDSGDRTKMMVASLKVLASIQKRGSLPPLPGVSEAFGTLMPEIYALYHDKKTQESLEKKLAPYIAKGDLYRIVEVVQDPDLLKKDLRSFKLAMIEYADLESENDILDKQLADKEGFGKATGNEFAAFVSSVIAGIVILFVLFTFMGGGSPL